MQTTYKNYFKECNTLDDAKNLFKILCFKIHPDTRPDKDKEKGHIEFIELFKQFKNFRPTEEHTRKGDDNFNADAFYNIVKRFDGLEDTLITFIGSFIWLEDEIGCEGATKRQKEEIKKILLDGYNAPRFAFKRKKWYYSPEGYKQRHRCTKSFDQLKYQWGHKTFDPSTNYNRPSQSETKQQPQTQLF